MAGLPKVAAPAAGRSHCFNISRHGGAASRRQSDVGAWKRVHDARTTIRAWRTRSVSNCVQNVSEGSGTAGGAFGLRTTRRLTAAFLAPAFLAAPRFLVALRVVFRVVFRALFFDAVLRVALRATLRVALRATLRAVFFAAVFLDAVLRAPFFAAAFFAGRRFVIAFAILSPLDPNCRNVS
ncbi:MAG: hypothetical protein HYS06_07930 [Methylocystis sp.]|nr:hypothetical protein [Methylocystis sp.]